MKHFMKMYCRKEKTPGGETHGIISDKRIETIGDRFRTSNLWRVFTLALGVLLISGGCTREKYRTKADKEVYDLLNTVGESDPLWEMKDFSLETGKQARYANLYNEDKQPMPQDDGTAHRLMQNVDGKKGAKKWYKNGIIDEVDNANWRQTLPTPVNGQIILDQKVAYELALIHSPAYRTAFENVYLSALSVTGERYAFDVQFYGGESLFYNNSGGFRKDSTSTLTNKVGDFNQFMKKKFATGGELVVGLANQMVWVFSPSGQSFSPTTTMSFDFTQPFLRGAGRAIVLEDLTLAERRLLANVRQLAFYQQGFYVGVLTGGVPVSTTTSGGYPTHQITVPSSVSSGFYGLLSQQAQIRNQQSNVVSLQDNLNRYEELFKAGRVGSRADVDRVRQSLLSGQSTLISQKNSYRNSVDNYLVNLGLPPDINGITIQDALLDRFVLMPERLDNISVNLDKLLGQLRNTTVDMPANLKDVVAGFKKGIEESETEVMGDMDHLQKEVYPNRVKIFQLLTERFKQDHPEIDGSFCEPAALEHRIHVIRGDFDRQNKELDEYGNERKKGIKWVLNDLFELLELTVVKYDKETLTRMLKETRSNPAQSPFPQRVIDLAYELDLDSLLIGDNSADYESQIETKKFVGAENMDLETKKALAREYAPDVEKETNAILNQGESDVDIYRIWIRDCFTRFSDELMSLRLIQARARLEALQLSVIDISAEEGFQIASEYRLDWMNVRSNLVDEWRNIEIVANKLKGYLNLEVGGSISNDGSNPVKFNGKNSTFTAGFSFDAPLSRLLERNEYRRALINYDQARRTYYTYVDNVKVQIRSTIRSIQLDLMDFEIQRESVLAAITRVQQSQLELTKPPTSESRVGSLTTSAAQNLVDSLKDLLSSQNQLMSTWLQYQAKRMGLLLVLGIFELDDNGRWVEPKDIDSDFLQRYITQITQTQDQLTGSDRLPTPEQLAGGRSMEDVRNMMATDGIQPKADEPVADSPTARSGSVRSSDSSTKLGTRLPREPATALSTKAI